MHILTVLVFLIIASTANAEDMTFRWEGTGGNCNGCGWISAEGIITAQTPKKFREFARQYGSGQHVSLRSAGGSLFAAIELGRLFRSKNTSVSVKGLCASACFFAFVGGKERYVTNGDKIGVHQFYSEGKHRVTPEVTQHVTGLVLTYTLEMGVDAKVVAIASNTPPSSVYWLSQKELEIYGIETKSTRQDKWRIEPYRDGFGLQTTFYGGSDRTVHLILHCLNKNASWAIKALEVTSKDNKEWIRINKIDDLEPMTPSIRLGNQQYSLKPEQVDAVLSFDRNFSFNVPLADDVIRYTNRELHFDPSLARAYGSILSFSVILPDETYFKAAANHCTK